MANLKQDRSGVLVMCPSCGKTNRLRYAGLASASQCGSCHTRLAPPAEPLDVRDAETFDTIVAASALPVVVDFWAPWCGPCRMMAPELEQVATGAAGEWLVLKVNTDAVPELGERYRVRSIPTLAVFQGGREVQRVAGARPSGDIRSFVRNALTVTSTSR